MTVLLASHLLHQVQTVCDRVAIFVDGKVMALGKPHELAAVEKGGRIKVEFRLAGDPTAARAKLESVGTVSDVAPGRTPGSWVGDLESSALGSTVSGLVGSGAEVIGVHRIDEDLESIYRRYFETREEVPA